MLYVLRRTQRNACRREGTSPLSEHDLEEDWMRGRHATAGAWGYSVIDELRSHVLVHSNQMRHAERDVRGDGGCRHG